MSTPDTALVIFAHGSSVESANEAVRDACRATAKAGGCAVEAAFLGGGSPDLEGAIGRLAQQGMRRVIVVPYFLTLGLHLQRDLPILVKEAAARYPEVRVEVAPPLDGHPSLVGILLDRAASIINGTTS